MQPRTIFERSSSGGGIDRVRDWLEFRTASNSSLLPSISSSPQRPATKKASTTTSSQLPSIRGTTITFTLIFVVCLTVMLSMNGDSYGHGTPHATVLGKRSWKDADLTKSQRLEAQLAMKNAEIEGLKTQLFHLQGTRLKTEVNMASQESLIMALQQRQDFEKGERYKAVHALKERSKDLDECSRQQRKLDEGLHMCERDLAAFQQRS